jgi:hypothetical protein
MLFPGCSTNGFHSDAASTPRSTTHRDASLYHLQAHEIRLAAQNTFCGGQPDEVFRAFNVVFEMGVLRFDMLGCFRGRV